MNKENLQSIVEALIFVSEHPMTIKQMQSAMDDVSLSELKAALDQIKQAYGVGSHGIYLESVGGGYQFRTKLDKASTIQKWAAAKPIRMTRAQLETLAIVAYKQPLTRIDVDGVRGVESTHILKMLLDKKLIRILGVKEVPGRPLLYGTTPEFLEFFTLRGLDALPTLESLKELKSEEMPLFARDSLTQEEVT